MLFISAPFAAYAPDKANAATISNVMPLADGSYGPFPGPSTISTALGARCQGAIGLQDTNGDFHIFAGTATGLYKIRSGESSFTDVSKVGGYSVGSDQYWSFTQWGTKVIATNIADAIQVYDLLAGGTFADLSADAPKARFVKVVRDWIVTANTHDPTDLYQPQRVWWSAFNNPTSWPTPGSDTAAQVQSDRQDLFGDHGPIQGIAAGLSNADAALFCERAVYRMYQAAAPITWGFDVVEGARGVAVPSSIVQDGGLVYYWSDAGFYGFDGSSSAPIGAGFVDQTVANDLDATYTPRMIAVADPTRHIVMWAYPGSGYVGGNPNKAVLYNTVSQRWAAADVDCEYLFRTYSLGYTLDQLDSLGFTLDTLPFSLDSRVWSGGRPQLSTFDTSHRLCFLSGDNLAPTVETDELVPGRDAGKRIVVFNVRPLADGGSPSVSIGWRNRLMDAVTYATPVATNSLGNSPQCISARYVRARMTLPAASDFDHLTGAEIEYRLEGRQ